MLAEFPFRTAILALAVASLGMHACGPDGDASAAGEASSERGGSLGQPTATFPEDFGAIQTVREMSDGTVLVADPLGGALYSVDLDAGTRVQVGAEGQGPEEYMQPDAVWRLPGDSTLLIDLGNGRMTTLAPDLSFGATSPLSAGDPRSGLVVAIPQAVDAEGRVYSRSLGMSMGGTPPDSGAVLRITRGTLALDTAAMYKLEDRTITRSGGPNNQNVSVMPVPLSPEDAWGAAPDGAVVMARAADYSIEWHAVDGTVTAGAPTPYEVISIGMREKEEWLGEQGQSGGGIGISVMMGPQGIQTNFSRGGGGGGDDPSVDDYEWPEHKPAFYSGRIVVDPMNRAWVRRHVEAGAPSTYDVFDRSAAREATYTLPHGSRVVGFGEDVVYVVSSDEFDLNYLQRYAMPAG
jgi:hypothetical protein